MARKADLSDAINPTAAILLPAAWAGVSGLAGGAIATSLALVNRSETPLAWGGLAAGATFGAAWLYGLTWWGGLVREIIGVSVETTAPAYPAETVRLEVTGDLETPYPWGAWLDLEMEPAPVYRALEALANGTDLSMSSLAGKGKPLSRSEFTTLRDALIRAKLAYWLNGRAHSQGCALNRAGANVIRRWAGMRPIGLNFSPTTHPSTLEIPKLDAERRV